VSWKSPLPFRIDVNVLVAGRRDEDVEDDLRIVRRPAGVLAALEAGSQNEPLLQHRRASAAEVTSAAVDTHPGQERAYSYGDPRSIRVRAPARAESVIGASSGIDGNAGC
jgi:hypothetical protein